MFPAIFRRAGRAALLLLALAGCEEAEGVDVQPLPPLKRPSPEARAGLPEVAGTWRFAGWELPVRDTATGGEGMLPPGVLAVRTQRLDSVAGDYLRDGQRFPFVGEVRRDGVFSVVAFGPDGAGSFIAGRVVRDTLWIELTSLAAAQTWSSGSRAALVRTPVRRPFVRYQGGYVPVNLDSIRADSIRVDSLRRADSLRLADSVGAAVPGAVQPVPGQAPGVPGLVAPPGAAPQRPPPAAPPATGAQPKQRETPRAAPKRQPPRETPSRRAQDSTRRRAEERATARRRRDTLRLPEQEESEEEAPARPDTARPRQPVIIP